MSVERRAETVRLAVEDDGPGLPEQEYSVLAAGRETQLEHASGLGLWLVYWVVTKCNGRLEFADRKPRSATVTVELPASDGVGSDGVASDRTASEAGA